MHVSSSSSALSTQMTYVEVTSLPRILVRAKGGMLRYYAYVNGYIRGPQCRLKGSTVVPLYYLSLVAMSGDGGKLQGIWSALISEPPQDVYLETVGTVVLAHHDPQFQSLGYTLHWTYAQGVTTPRAGDLHAVIESNMLTMFDPVAGAAPLIRERKQHSNPHHDRRSNEHQKSRSQPKVLLTTASKKELGVLEERVNREKHPLFLLLVPGAVLPSPQYAEPEALVEARRVVATTNFLSELYFSFLDLRTPWAMSLDWASFLWQCALAQQENVKLTTWFKDVVQETGEGEEQTTDENAPQKAHLPVFTEAWLCRPNVARLAATLKEALRQGRISTVRDTTASAVPSVAGIPVPVLV